MDNYCTFSQNHKCLKWIDFELTKQELKEADSLCHKNWIEIQYLTNRIHLLENLLKESGIDISF